MARERQARGPGREQRHRRAPGDLHGRGRCHARAQRRAAAAGALGGPHTRRLRHGQSLAPAAARVSRVFGALAPEAREASRPGPLLVLVGLSSTTLAALSSLSTVATALVVVGLGGGVAFLGWRTGGAGALTASRTNPSARPAGR